VRRRARVSPRAPRPGLVTLGHVPVRDANGVFGADVDVGGLDGDVVAWTVTRLRRRATSPVET